MPGLFSWPSRNRDGLYNRPPSTGRRQALLDAAAGIGLEPSAVRGAWRRSRMPEKFTAAALAAAVWALALTAWAHSDGDEAPPPQTLDCEHLPAKALTALPAPFDVWARLDCLPAGQLLAQPRDWIWRYPASFTTPVFVPAWTADPAAVAASARYFTAAEVAVARGEGALALHRRFAQELEVYGAMTAERPAPTAVHTLIARNDLDQELRVHFVYRSPQDVWGIVCTPDCRSEYSFLVSSRGN
jgi:hypothetical protein